MLRRELPIPSSGSSGNCTCVETNEARVLVDAGFSDKPIRRRQAGGNFGGNGGWNQKTHQRKAAKISTTWPIPRGHHQSSEADGR
jgi:hypothetical protein